MLVIENPRQQDHKPNWEFILGTERYHTRDVPDRITAIKNELEPNRFKYQKAETFPATIARKLHPYHDYLKNTSAKISDPTVQIYPDVFPGEGAKLSSLPKSSLWAGYYCTDSVTPITKHSYLAAKGSADAALTGAKLLASKKLREVYALCRPPGHHAGPRVFGGYCYFNNTGIAAHYLSPKGRVAILDIDYHHGNGTQELFYNRKDVFTVSVHGHPSFEYPYFLGYPNELGTGKGKNCNLNVCLPLAANNEVYLKALRKACKAIKKYNPDFLIIGAGFDTFELDPVGQAKLTTEIYPVLGREIGSLGYPTLICQEGGYNLEGLGRCVGGFLDGFLFERE